MDAFSLADSFGVKAIGNFLRDLTLDCEQIIQIAVVFLGPNVGVGARVDQLRIQVNPITAPACASFQHVRHAKRIADLTHISFAAIFHHAGPADDFQVGDLRQLGQNVVLHTIGEDGVILSGRSDFQTAKRRCQLLADGGSIHFSK